MIGDILPLASLSLALVLVAALLAIWPPKLAEEVETEACSERGCGRLHSVLHSSAAKAATVNWDCTSDVVVPAEQIVRHAEADDVDPIVDVHRGHALLDRRLIGYVAPQAIACAPCAVTLARPAAQPRG